MTNNEAKTGAGIIDNLSTEVKRRRNQVMDTMETCIVRAEVADTEEELQSAIDDFKLLYALYRDSKAEYSENQQYAVSVKVDKMKSTVDRQRLKLKAKPKTKQQAKKLTPIEKLNENSNGSSFPQKPDRPITPEIPSVSKQLYISSHEALNFGRQLAFSLLDLDDCLEMADKWLHPYEGYYKVRDIEDFKSIILNGCTMARRNSRGDTITDSDWLWYGKKGREGREQFTWYGDAVQSKGEDYFKPLEWESEVETNNKSQP